MARIKLSLPASLPYKTEIKLRVTDLNYGNHMGNEVVLALAHEARVRFLESFGYTELDAEGVSFIMGDAAIVYKSEGLYGQEISVEVGAGEFARVSFDLYYRFVIKGKEKELAIAKTGMVCFDYKAQKVVELPEKLRLKLGGTKS